MKRLFVPTSGIGDWRRFLGDPARHWVQGRSAFELAAAWESASNTPRGLPPEVSQLLDSHPGFQGATLLFAVPEHQVEFEGGGHASQNDIWALLHAPLGLVSLTVEAKAGEAFGPTVEEWLAGAIPASGKPARLRQLKTLLGITQDVPGNIRYQLLHRTGSAVREAERFGASAALMLVQSFAPDPDSEAAFDTLCALLGCKGNRPSIIEGSLAGTIRLYLGWANSRPSPAERQP